MNVETRRFLISGFTSVFILFLIAMSLVSYVEWQKGSGNYLPETAGSMNNYKVLGVVVNEKFQEGENVVGLIGKEKMKFSPRDLYTMVVKTDKGILYVYEFYGARGREMNLIYNPGSEITINLVYERYYSGDALDAYRYTSAKIVNNY